MPARRWPTLQPPLLAPPLVGSAFRRNVPSCAARFDSGAVRASPGWTVTIGAGPHGKFADVWHRHSASPSRRSTAGLAPWCPPAMPASAPMRRGRLAARPARCWSPGAFGRAKITSLVVAADHPPPTTTTAPPSAAPWPGGRCRSPRRPARGRCPITWLRRPTASGGNTGGDERRPGSAILYCRGGSAVVRRQSRARSTTGPPKSPTTAARPQRKF